MWHEIPTNKTKIQRNKYIIVFPILSVDHLRQNLLGFEEKFESKCESLGPTSEWLSQDFLEVGYRKWSLSSLMFDNRCISFEFKSTPIPYISTY